MYTIWQLSKVELGGKLHVQGVIVHGDGKLPPKGHVRRIIYSYLIKPAKNTAIQIRIGQSIIETQTDNKGGFNEIIEGSPTDPITIWAEPYKAALRCVQQYPVHYHLDDHSLYVVSDIDDTILYSYSPYTFKRIKTALFVRPDKRRPIRSTHQILKKLESEGAAVVYLSKSESNLLPNISGFIDNNGLPKGLLFLTPFLTGIQLFNPKKNPQHKIECLRRLLDQTNAPFVLIGDDGQKDLKIYSQICLEYTERIQKVYIYKTKDQLSARKRKQWKMLNATGVPSEYLGKFSSINQE